MGVLMYVCRGESVHCVSPRTYININTTHHQQQAPTSYHILLYTLSFGLGDTGRCWLVVCVSVNVSARETDQTTTLCVQEVEIYLERWEVLGALVVVDVG